MTINQTVKNKIIAHYPHLRFIADERTFAQNALRLAAVPGVAPIEYYNLAKLAR